MKNCQHSKIQKLSLGVSPGAKKRSYATASLQETCGMLPVSLPNRFVSQPSQFDVYKRTTDRHHTAHVSGQALLNELSNSNSLLHDLFSDILTLPVDLPSVSLDSLIVFQKFRVQEFAQRIWEQSYHIAYFNSVDPYRITKSIWIWK